MSSAVHRRMDPAINSHRGRRNDAMPPSSAYLDDPALDPSSNPKTPNLVLGLGEALDVMYTCEACHPGPLEERLPLPKDGNDDKKKDNNDEGEEEEEEDDSPGYIDSLCQCDEEHFDEDVDEDYYDSYQRRRAYQLQRRDEYNYDPRRRGSGRGRGGGYDRRDPRGMGFHHAMEDDDDYESIGTDIPSVINPPVGDEVSVDLTLGTFWNYRTQGPKPKNRVPQEAREGPSLFPVEDDDDDQHAENANADVRGISKRTGSDIGQETRLHETKKKSSKRHKLKKWLRFWKRNKPPLMSCGAVLEEDEEARE